MKKMFKWLFESCSFKVQVVPDFKKQSENALFIFKATLDSLNKVNLSILKREDELNAEILSRETERNNINAIAKENGSIIMKINHILK